MQTADIFWVGLWRFVRTLDLCFVARLKDAYDEVGKTAS
jgi:hypothetical protein